LRKNLLFITWDSDTSNYLETLFFPILSGLQSRGEIKPFVCQFSWADRSEVNRLSLLAAQQGIEYIHIPIPRKPHPLWGTFLALWRSKRILLSYIRKNRIDVLMPRSTMPAFVVLRLINRLSTGLALIYDADGLPIQERIDFSNLSKKSIMHSFLSRIEISMLSRADKVLVRTNRSTEIHLQKQPHFLSSKFFKVGNGRDERVFYYDSPSINTRIKLGIREDELLLVHSGSLGGGYETDRMFGLLQTLLDYGVAAKLLFLTRDERAAQALIPDSLRSDVVVLSVAFGSIPEILRASDIGICFRKKAKSIAGIAPIKLGEYLMCGLPVLMSEGIGDFDQMLQELPFVWMVRETIDSDGFIQWQRDVRSVDRRSIAEYGRIHFSLESTLDSYQQALTQ
jgi:hypothetical protein